jgi:hypothetical protein
MKRYLDRLQLLTVVFTLAFSLLLLLPGRELARLTAGQNENPALPPYLPPYGNAPKEQPSLLGAVECQLCHNNENPQKEKLYELTRGFEFVLLHENGIWQNHDLHSRAFDNLTNAQGLIMQANLRQASGDTKYEVARDKNCLACHASLIKPSEPLAERSEKSFSIREGVGCEMCHGHGSQYRTVHRDPLDVNSPNKAETVVVPWRADDPARKSRWGMVNLRDPAVAAEKCASCHVGNSSEGKFVTHEMYAAGHPPLPPLDVMAYTRDQPRHWGLPRDMRYLTDLARIDPKKAWEAFHYRQESEEVYGARRFAVSSLGTLRASISLLGQQAGQAEKAQDGLDFAMFDCSSCHHDLKYPSDRQKRGYTGPPGRPLFRPATFALARIIVAHAATMPKGESMKEEAKALEELSRELGSAFGSRTFGDPRKIVAAAGELEKWSQRAIAKMEPLRYSREETIKLMRLIAAEAQRPLADPEVAQLLAWGFETLRQSLRENVPDSAEPAGLAELCPQLEGMVVTRLRPNLPLKVLPGKPETDSLVPVADRINARMKLFNSFEQEKFSDLFRKIEPLLSELK